MFTTKGTTHPAAYPFLAYLRIRMSLENAVYDEMVFSQSSYRLKSNIWGSVALRIKSPNFSIFNDA